MRFKTEEDLQTLIDTSTPENYALEYKSEPWSDRNPAHEIAKDISSFANTQGGTLIVGIKEDNETKKPVALTPFEVDNWVERIDSVNHTSIKPSIESLRINRVPSKKEEGKEYLVIAIPESPNVPHMAVYSNRYYKRDNSGVRRMSEAEVAALYERRQAQQERMEEYYAPLFAKLKEEQSKVGENEMQSFFLFLPRIFKEERFPLYYREVASSIQQIFDNVQDFPRYSERAGEFLHYFYGNPGDYNSTLPNVWLHPTGGIIVIGERLDYKESPRVMPKYVPWWIESVFSLANRIYLQESEELLTLSIQAYFIGAGPLYSLNFLPYYPDKQGEFMQAQFMPSANILAGRPRGGEPNILIKRNVVLDQLEGEALQKFLKNDFLVELLKKFGL